VLLDQLVRAGVHEDFDRQDREREHVELAQDRDPGREVDGAHDHAEGTDQGGLWSRRHPLVAEQAVGQLGVFGHVEEKGADACEAQRHGNGVQPTRF